MKLLFSEARPAYENYIFPYAIWAFPEEGEAPSELFQAGFLPSSAQLDRFYLCRHIRVDLADFELTSENRRIIRKGAGIRATLIPRGQFDLTEQRREFYKTYADIKFGKDKMTHERLERIFSSKILSHILLFTDEKTGQEVGAVTLYLEKPSLGYYYYSFYDLNYYQRNLGMFMMTTAVELLANAGYRFAYLGTCYSQNALYKAQFRHAEFFNGFQWSRNLKELRYLIERSQTVCNEHLLESPEYRERFAPADNEVLAGQSFFKVRPGTG